MNNFIDEMKKSNEGIYFNYTIVENNLARIKFFKVTENGIILKSLENNLTTESKIDSKTYNNLLANLVSIGIGSSVKDYDAGDMFDGDFYCIYIIKNQTITGNNFCCPGYCETATEVIKKINLLFEEF